MADLEPLYRTVWHAALISYKHLTLASTKHEASVGYLSGFIIAISRQYDLLA